MEEDNIAMEEQQHEQLDELQQQLRPELWETLPIDLIRKIVLMVLADVPFSRILSFCHVFKPWVTDFLVSRHYILYSNMDSCMICDPRTGLWDSISLDFCAADGDGEELKSSRDLTMQQVYGDRGLLHLSSGNANDEYSIVCNPLTGKYKRFTSSKLHARRPNFNDEELGSSTTSKIITSDTTWRVAFCRQSHVPFPSSGSWDYLLAVKVVVYDSPTSYFHLTVAKLRKDSTKHLVGVTDSRCIERKRWDYIRNETEDFTLFVEPTLFFEGSIVLGFGTCDGGYRVLTYDVGLRRCAWIWTVEGIRSLPNTPLTATVIRNHEVEFFHVVESRRGMALAPSPFPPSTKGLRSHDANGSVAEENGDLTELRNNMDVFNIVPVEDGDFVYFVGILQLSMAEPLQVSVRTHSRVDGSDRISSWKEWKPSGLESGRLPSPKHFCIFKPSLNLSPD
ncbi:unnamed protein product [Calypogeia fissa]